MKDEPKLVCVNCGWEHATRDCPNISMSQIEWPQSVAWVEPDQKLAKLHIELAGIALATGSENGRVAGVVVNHLNIAINALLPKVPKTVEMLDRENTALESALNLAKQHIAAEFGFEDWRIEQINKLAKS